MVWAVRKDGQTAYYGKGPLTISTETPWKNPIVIYAVYSKEQWPPEDWDYNYDGSHGVPAYLKLTVPSSINLTPFGLNCAAPVQIRECGRDIPIKSICSHINPPGTILLRYRKTEGDTFIYNYANPMGVCVEAKIKAFWSSAGVASPYLPGNILLDNHTRETVTGCEVLPSTEIPPYLIPIAVADITVIVRDADDNHWRIRLYKYQLLGNHTPYQSVLAAYRTITEMQPGNCTDPETGQYPCIPATGDYFTDNSDPYAYLSSIVPPFSPLHLFPSRGGSLPPYVNALNDFDGFYIYTIGGRLVKLESCGDSRYQYCPTYSRDPQRTYNIGCPSNSTPSWNALAAACAARDGETFIAPTNNVSPPFKLESDNGSTWPNDASKCRCVARDDVPNWFFDERTSLLYLEPGATSPTIEGCYIECQSVDPYSLWDIEMDCFPRGFAIELPPSIALGWYNCHQYTDYPTSSNRISGLPSIVYVKAPGDCTDVSRGTYIAPTAAFFLNQNFSCTPSQWDCVTVKYRVPNPDSKSCTISTLEIDVGYVITTVEEPYGPDTTDRLRLFTQARLHIYVNDDTGVPRQVTLYSVNPGPEFNLSDYNTGALDDFPLLNNPWRWIHNFEFTDFCLAYLPVPPDYPGADPNCNGYSLSLPYWQMSRARKLYMFGDALETSVPVTRRQHTTINVLAVITTCLTSWFIQHSTRVIFRRVPVADRISLRGTCNAPCNHACDFQTPAAIRPWIVR